jgi:hypothetical protein
MSQNQDGKVFNYHNGKCYVAADPLFGAEGSQGSPWVQMGNEIIARGEFDNVVVIARTYSQDALSKITGDDFNAFKSQLTSLKLDYAVTHFLLHQGDKYLPIYQDFQDASDNISVIRALSLSHFTEAKFITTASSACESDSFSVRATDLTVSFGMNVLLGYGSPNVENCEFTRSMQKNLGLSNAYNVRK